MKKLFMIAFALVFSTGIALAQDNDASIDTDGDRNDAAITQKLDASSSEASITQDGDANTGDITQQYGQYHEAMLEQVGDRNSATLTQDNTNTHADLYQEGDGNTIMAFQRSRLFGGPGVSITDLEVDQIGNGNFVDVDMDAESPTGESKTNVADLDQEGDRNTIMLEQDRSDVASNAGNGLNSATISQVGNGNYTNASQDGRGHALEQSVMGDRNDLYSTQTGRFAYLNLEVDGDGNWMMSTQSDGGNRAFFDLMGDRNTVTLDQSSNGNQVGATITGSANDINVLQSGSSNRVIGPGKAFTQQGIVVDGNRNMVDVDQLSSGNHGVVSIHGDGNMAVIDQQ
jgi:hypothetical protein